MILRTFPFPSRMPLLIVVSIRSNCLCVSAAIFLIGPRNSDLSRGNGICNLSDHFITDRHLLWLLPWRFVVGEIKPVYGDVMEMS